MTLINKGIWQKLRFILALPLLYTTRSERPGCDMILYVEGEVREAAVYVRRSSLYYFQRNDKLEGDQTILNTGQ